jgi:hypothetical protein
MRTIPFSNMSIFIFEDAHLFITYQTKKIGSVPIISPRAGLLIRIRLTPKF